MSAEVERVLAEHVWGLGRRRCSCGERVDGPIAHRCHVAQVLADYLGWNS